MKAFFQTFTVSILGGFLSYYMVKGSLVGYLWLIDTELASDKRYWIHQQGDLVFLIGALLSLIGCLVIKNLDKNR